MNKMSETLTARIEYWQEQLGRALTDHEKMVAECPFKYNAYWRVWNRVLKPFVDGQLYGYVEFSLEPINGWPTLLKPNIREKEILIRKHVTTPSRRDTYDVLVPVTVENQMVKHFGVERTKYMLYDPDIFDIIDWLKYQSVSTSGGGVPLDLCKKG
jgi:hypothetical protein